jgi:hypothetical protein
MNSPLEIREARLRGLLRRHFPIGWDRRGVEVGYPMCYIGIRSSSPCFTPEAADPHRIGGFCVP